MNFLKFEYKVTIFYLLFGCLWILLSDTVLNALVTDSIRLKEIQTYKGWFYVLITATILFLFLKKHLKKKRAIQKELRESESKYREVFDNINDCLFLLEVLPNARFKFVEFNPAAVRSVGLSNEFISGKFIEEVFPDDVAQILNSNYKKCLDSGKIISYTEQLFLPIGCRLFRTTLVPLFSREGEIYRILGFGHDITEANKRDLELENYRNHLEKLVQKKTNDLENVNQELRSINDELYDKNKIINSQNEELISTVQHLKSTQAQLLQAEKMASIGVLTAGVAHEINNPLNYIMGAYVGLQRHFENNSFSENRDQIAILIKALKTGVDRSSAIVSSLNQFSRSSKSHGEVCNIHAIIENCITILHYQFTHNISLIKQFHNTEIEIKGNVGDLHQVFTNIISNAIQAILSEGSIQIKTALSEERIIIEITDTGEGILPENITKVTDPFFTTKDPGKGTGLGLSITYNILQEHKGSIEFQSEAGKGTKVIVSLPNN